MSATSNIFSSHNLYPFSGKIKDHFKEEYDEVMISFLPFYDQKVMDSTSEKEICQKVKVVSWATVCSEAGFNDLSELYKALKTSNSSLRPILAQPELAQQLNDYIDGKGIQAPVEGAYDLFSKVAIYNTFEILGKHEVVVTDEFYESTISLNLKEMDAFEFSEKIACDAYYIYPEDKDFLFTMEWDSFFFLFASRKQDMKLIQSSNLFEGFLCDENTEHNWYFKDGELESLLEMEKMQERKLKFRIKRFVQSFIGYFSKKPTRKN